jgi:hypothetical protein
MTIHAVLSFMDMLAVVEFDDGFLESITIIENVLVTG